jgi:ligand-binding SRPBCC domain-containing protein
VNIVVETQIEKNFRDIFSHFDEKLFKKLKPPFVKLQVERFDGCKAGDEVHLKISALPFKTDRWVSHIVESRHSDDEIYFIDIGAIIPFPLKSWKHTHRIVRINESRSLVIDDIEFTSGNIQIDKILYPFFLAMFKFRRPVYKRELE